MRNVLFACILLLCCLSQSNLVSAQEPGLAISDIFANPSGAEENLEYVELTATKSINFVTTPYTVVYIIDAGNATSDGWKTGGTATYAIEISTGSIAVGEKIYVGGSSLAVNGGASCKKIQQNTVTTAGDGGIGTGGGVIMGNGGNSADGVGVFNIAAASITASSIPVDAIFYGAGVGSAANKFNVPTNDHYSNAQGKFGAGTNTYLAPDPGGDQYILGTGEFNPAASTWTTIRNFALTSTVPNCTSSSTITVAVPNSLTFTVSASTTTYLQPPNVSGVIGNSTDPATDPGIIFSVKDNGVDIPSANYTMTAASTNTAVVPVANISITKSNGLATVKINPTGVGYTSITLTLDKSGLTKTYVINYAASANGTNSNANTKYHSGFSDGSAAQALDENYMIIADDENNKLNVYHRKNSGLPVKTFDYATLLGLTDMNGGVPREIDCEGTAGSPFIANRDYWIGSMSNKSSEPPYDDRPNRNRIFATTVSGTGAATNISIVGYYSNMRSQIIAWGDANSLGLSASAANGKDPKLIDGFNIEGLCFAPDNSTLYIGFRAPLLPTAARTKALIAPVLNFESWFNNGAPAGNPSFGSPILLDLNNWGIRSIDRLSNGMYVIVAGNYDDGTYSGAIYTWSGNAADAPIVQNGFNISGMSPEAFLEVTNSGVLVLNQLQAISDNGAFVYYNDGIAAKDLGTNNFKKFRSDIVTNIANVLPIIFTSFDLQLRNRSNVYLQWNMQDISEVAAFEVQRSQGGNAFTTMATVHAVNNISSYHFEDLNVHDGSYEYRIRAVNKNGSENFTTVRLANIRSRPAYASVYPNPVLNGVFTIVTNDNKEKSVKIRSASGNLVFEKRFDGTSEKLNIEKLPAGFYVVEVRSKADVEFIQVMKR